MPHLQKAIIVVKLSRSDFQIPLSLYGPSVLVTWIELLVLPEHLQQLQIFLGIEIPICTFLHWWGWGALLRYYYITYNNNWRRHVLWTRYNIYPICVVHLHYNTYYQQIITHHQYISVKDGELIFTHWCLSKQVSIAKLARQHVIQNSCFERPEKNLSYRFCSHRWPRIRT